jgi:methylenetetrahydrofolate reductase (NADPH)
MTPTDSPSIARFVRGYSIEITRRDRRSILEASGISEQGTEVYIAATSRQSSTSQLHVARELRRSGMTPVPHIVARDIADIATLDETLGRLAGEARVDRAFVLAGDRDVPAGEFSSSLDLIESGIFGEHGITRIRISAYPEGHPFLSSEALDSARDAKLIEGARIGLQVGIVTQICFDSAPVITLVRQLRARGVRAALRVGIAGLGRRGLLLRHAARCGVGSSVDTVRRRDRSASSLFDEMLLGVASAQAAEPTLDIEGVHFFPFGRLAATARRADELYLGKGNRN